MVERSLIPVALIVALQIQAAIAYVVLPCPPTSCAHILTHTDKRNFETQSPQSHSNHQIGNSNTFTFQAS
jgi:hypothetical protein